MCVCACVCVCTWQRSEEHTSELQSHLNLVCRLLLEKNACVCVVVCVCVYVCVCVSLVVLACVCESVRTELCTCVSFCMRDFVCMSVCFFFLNDGAPSEFSSFPLRASLRF